jgi:hypothetical protein
MKHIKIQHFTLPDKESVYTKRQKYKCSLGNGYAGLFSSSKELLAFMTETNVFLNEKLHELNFIYIELFGFYRLAWFYLDQQKNSQLNLKGLEQQTTNNINGINQAFNLIVSRSGYTNGNHFVFTHFKSIIKPSLELCGNLLILYKSKGHTDKVYKLNYLVRQLNNLNKELEIYPKTETNLIQKLNELL